MKAYKQIDGKFISEKPSKLDSFSHECTGNIVEKYKNEKEYLEYLSSLSKNELQIFAVHNSVIPTDSIDRLIKLLMAEYKKTSNRTKQKKV